MTGPAKFASRNTRGMSLVEMMIALALGLLVSAGIVNVFMVTSGSSLVQTQVSKLQEEGRFAITALTTDLRMANAQYCSNMGGQSSALSNGVMSLDRYLRTPKVLVSGAALQAAISDNTTTWGSSSGGNTYPAAPTAAFSLPSFLSMRGYDCTTTACLPLDPGSSTAGAIPTQGTDTGKRVLGSSILTLRYLDGARGWTLDGVNSKMTMTGKNVTQFSITPQTGEPLLTDYTSGDLLMLADCNSAQVFAATASGNTATPVTTATYGTVVQPSGVSPKIFDFNRDYQTITYYLQVVDNGNGAKTGALMKRLNGVSSEVVRGVERLDFLYGVMDAAGNTSFRTASEMDSATSCASSSVTVAGTDPGCLWRSVQTIEVHILMDGQLPLYSLTPTDLQYQYYGDAGVTGLAAPDALGRTVKPSQQGFDNHMLRREFSALVSVRNYNP